MKQANLTKLVNAVKLCTEAGKTTELREAYGTLRLKKKQVFFRVLLPVGANKLPPICLISLF